MKPLSYRLLLVCLAGILLLSGCSIVAPPVRQLGDTIIDSAEVWAGTIRINGIVTVKKEGTLTIQPGTKILFARNDLDGDGIGDSELLVEGGLIARGTVDAPIIFTSAEEQPQKADWKYLYLDFARQAIVEHVISEYAYSGIQVHFCKASIENSVFRNNVDGVRFSTVNIVVQGNSIYNNKHGLRYEERRSKALVTGNDIHDNEIGIFVVTRSEDKAKIVRNNIVDNSDYNVKLGITQHADVTLPENWWGNLSVEEITTTFFDKKQDESLGQVRAPAPLKSPVSIAAAVRE